MKILMSFFALILLISSCTNSANQANIDSSGEKDTINYPFKTNSSANYVPGDKKNIVLVLNCLQKYIDNDIKGCVSYFADSAEFIADRFDFKGSRDSLQTIIAAMRGASASVSKNFDTWAALYYPDVNENWVTLWYTEVMKDKNGKIDSIYYTDDVLLKNGKIVLYDEKQRLFPAKK
ncbi:MAG TPA: hypothetical protein VKR32_09570 [Puia sp.]|nr:hypothetical protein [Puia sp.]